MSFSPSPASGASPPPLQVNMCLCLCSQGCSQRFCPPANEQTGRQPLFLCITPVNSSIPWHSPPYYCKEEWNRCCKSVLQLTQPDGRFIVGYYNVRKMHNYFPPTFSGWQTQINALRLWRGTFIGPRAVRWGPSFVPTNEPNQKPSGVPLELMKFSRGSINVKN